VKGPSRGKLVAIITAVGITSVAIVGGLLVMAGGFPVARVEIPLPQRSSHYSGDQAYQYLHKICELGPRITATPAMFQQQELLKRHFESLGATVELQQFEGTQPSIRRPFRCVNLIVHWHPERKRRVLLGAHYDTRPIADQEPVMRHRQQPILGANDGASGVAFLMELGRVIPSLDLQVGVDFVFFDAEEIIYVPETDRFFLGSEHFVKEYTTKPPEYRYEAVIVVDMIGDRDLEILPDQRSMARAGALVEEVWTVANRLGVPQFINGRGPDVLDDHIAFQKAGIPAIVLIDFGYPHWHRLTDTPDKCSGASLEAVSRVIIEWLKQQQ
jgi:hypothetical protein